MSSIVIAGDTSGTVTLSAPAVAGTPTLTLPTTTGSLVTSSVSTVTTLSPYSGFKNRIINPLMAIDQRNAGASQTITAAAALAYTIDRWYAYCTGANVTGQRVAGAYTSSQYRYQFTGAASVTAIGFGQRIEAANSYDLANTTATLSCYISNSLLTSVTWTAYYATTTDTFGTLASPTRTQIATGTFTVSSTRAQYTASISIPSAATTGIEIVFTVGAQTSGTWIIDTVQLEASPTATTFEYRSFGAELALCQRYYQKSFSLGTAPADGINQSSTDGTTLHLFNSYDSGNGFFSPVYFQVKMRTSPTITFYRSGGNGVTNGVWGTFDSGWTSVTTMTLTTCNDMAFLATGARTSAFTTKTAYVGSGTWTASGEL